MRSFILIFSGISIGFWISWPGILIPNNWKDIMKFYNTKHIPHVTIKTLLSKNDKEISR